MKKGILGLSMGVLLAFAGLQVQADTFEVDGAVCVIDNTTITGVTTASGELTLDAGYKPAGTTITQTANVTATLDGLVDQECAGGTVEYTISASSATTTGPITTTGASVTGTTTFADGIDTSVIVTSITSSPSNHAQRATWSVPYTVTITAVGN